MDLVFNRSPQKEKRGRPSRKDRLYRILAASGKESDTSKRRVLPRSAKKHRSAFAAGSSDVYDFEMDSEGSVDVSPLTSEHGNESMGDAEISVDKGVHRTTVPDIQQAANVRKTILLNKTLQQVSNGNGLSKRKRGRPRKTVVVESMKEMQRI
ncbi:unnamed protein product [Angiostrongylus costaricensis]|uniref:Uncharacterized protein n=1 Tax=Angiostrongylus costaricensis TaxID=334426 RepID=A0A0R3PHQ6_ANGCS|nr:unnamed protein product [Angiostrongylus costaricensis]